MKSHDEVQYEGNDSFSLERRSSWHHNWLCYPLRDIKKGIRASRMKQIRSYLLISLIGLLSLFARPAFSESRTVGLVRATCTTPEAVMRLAKEDSTSVERAKQIFGAFVKAGICGSLPLPTMLELETKIHEYIDVEGVSSQVWKIKNFNHWTLIASSSVSVIPAEKKREPGLSV